MPDASDIKENMLLWCDLETTGSDVNKDCIIEIACILTDSHLNEISQFQSLVHPTDAGLGRLMKNEIVREMHQKNGLLDELIMNGKNAPRVDEVSRAVVKWLEAVQAPKGKIVLAGSGVGHFDRAFIQKYMPQVQAFLRYWVIDIGVLRRGWEMFTGHVLPRTDPGQSDKAHRAMDDIVSHLWEARDIRDTWIGFDAANWIGDDAQVAG